MGAVGWVPCRKSRAAKLVCMLFNISACSFHAAHLRRGEARRSVRRALIESHLRRSDCAHQVRQEQAPPVAPSDFGAKFVMAEEQPATEFDPTGLEETPGACRSTLERISHRAASLPSCLSVASRGPPTRHGSMVSPWKVWCSRMLDPRVEVNQAGSAAVQARRAP